ncbi:MAG: hypothetical protein ACK4NO_03170 [Glycocaulis sp.]
MPPRLRIAVLPVLALAFALAGCATREAASIGTVAEPDGQIMAALDIGLRAQAAGDGPGLLAASSLLDGAGARPADGEDDLAALWREQAAVLGEAVPPVRGRIAGPAYRNGVIGAGEAALLRDSFHSGRAARVSVQTRGTGTLRLSIRRADGEAVCETLVGAAPVTCQWVPVWSEPFHIEITNLTAGTVAYYLITN